jgi:hypothetical protein
MIDWFWSNMEKGFILWHPDQHEALEWAVAPKNGNPLGAIHIAPQTWNDGRRQNLYIRFEKLSDVPPPIRDLLIYEHVIIVAGLGLGPECLVHGSQSQSVHGSERRGKGTQCSVPPYRGRLSSRIRRSMHSQPQDTHYGAGRP